MPAPAVIEGERQVCFVRTADLEPHNNLAGAAKGRFDEDTVAQSYFMKVRKGPKVKTCLTSPKVLKVPHC